MATNVQHQRKDIRIASFNCHGFKSSQYEVAELCEKADILFLQETWLSSFELHMVNEVRADFTGKAWSAMDSQCLTVGRPFGGLAVLWKKDLNIVAVNCSILNDRAVYCIFKGSHKDLHVVNVYMPYAVEDVERKVEYMDVLGLISSNIRDKCTSDYLLILGDFNASVENGFLKFVTDFALEEDMCVSDRLLLDDSTFTFSCPARGTKSWIDHIVSSRKLHDSIRRCEVDYSGYVSDHNPVLLCIEDAFSFANCISSSITDSTSSSSGKRKVFRWDRVDDSVKANYITFVEQQLYELKCPECMEGSHCVVHDNVSCIDYYLEVIVNVVSEACDLFIPQRFSEDCVGDKNPKSCVQGWNESVKGCHAVARRHYKHWNEAGRPRAGEVYDNMCMSRKSFKAALRGCRRAVDSNKADKLALKLAGRDMKTFWKGVSTFCATSKEEVANNIDGFAGADAITFWKDKYERMFNERNFNVDREQFLSAVNSCNNSNLCITEEMVGKALLGMKKGKAAGFDDIYAEALQLGASILVRHLSVLFNMMLGCSYVSKRLLEIRLCPILKDKAGDVSNSDNYRLIAVASSILKLFESVLLEHLQACVPVADEQFGFRSGYSTDLCTDVFKSAVKDFCTNGSYVFACFVDLSKAFDTVNFWKLFDILRVKGVARNVLNVLCYSYSNEMLKVYWKGESSLCFGRSSGTRQGSPLSPFLFSVYIDSVLCSLSSCSVGCRIRGRIISYLVYADDIVLLAPSWHGLQSLMHVLAHGVKAKDLLINYKKTKCMIFQPYYKKFRFLANIPNFQMDNNVIEFCDNYKHLGHVIDVSLSDVRDMRRELRLLFFRTNRLISLFGKCNVEIKRLLWNAFVNGLYGVGIWELNESDKLFFKRAYNGCLKKFFGFSKYDRNRLVYYHLNLVTVDTLFVNAVYRHNRLKCEMSTVNSLIGAVFFSPFVVYL